MEGWKDGRGKVKGGRMKFEGWKVKVGRMKGGKDEGMEGESGKVKG